MPKLAAPLNQSELEKHWDPAMRPAFEPRDIVVVAVCAVIGFGLGYLGDKFGELNTGMQFFAAGATVLVAIIVAIGVISFINSLSARWAISRQHSYSEDLSLEIYRRLEEKSPGVKNRAQEIDPRELLYRNRPQAHSRVR